MATTRTAVVEKIERLQNTKQGNPRYELSLEDGHVFTTRPDSTIGYEVTDGWVGKAMVLTLFDGEILSARLAQ